MVRLLAGAADPLAAQGERYDALMDLVGDARVVLIGEASHGTHEFYQRRAEITRLLIQDEGFDAVALEAPWPDAYRVDRYVRGVGPDRSGTAALEAFKGEFPEWMWRNRDVLQFVEWQRRHNAGRAPADQAGFYGLDLYGLFPSLDAVLGHLDRADPAAAARARSHYRCFERYREEETHYGLLPELCTEQAEAVANELRAAASEVTRAGGQLSEEAFDALRNAEVVVAAERFYRASHGAGTESGWNVRDRHMAAALDAVLTRLDRPGAPSRIVVWAHNSHVGDARATEVASQGQVNIGQLARERYGDDAILVGFSTYTGTVTAASAWGGAGTRMTVRPGLPDSYEDLFHRVAGTTSPDFLVTLRTGLGVAAGVGKQRLQRAIGVIYVPALERTSHYYTARLRDQFDAMIHLDTTTAVQQLP